MSMKEIAMTGRMWENVGKTVQLWLQALCSCSTPFCESVFCTIGSFKVATYWPLKMALI